jgi:acetyl esterase/lipase
MDPSNKSYIHVTTTRQMKKLFLSALLLTLFESLPAQNTNTGEEIIYGRKDGVALTMLVFKPASNSKNKAIIRVIAGSWYSSYGQAVSEGNLLITKEYFTEKGYTVFEVIVGSQPRFAIPDQVNDVKRAVRYIRYYAKIFDIDPDHMGISGFSAGGHLSLAVATADEKIDTASKDPVDHVSSRVQAVAVLFPPTDFLNWPPFGNIVNAKPLLLANSVFGAVDFKQWNNKTKTYDAIIDTAQRNKIGKEISPVYAVTPDDPPVFIIHGDADNVVPLQQSQLMISKLKEAGVSNNFIIKKGAKHSFDDVKPEFSQFTDWFDKYLK